MLNVCVCDEYFIMHKYMILKMLSIIMSHGKNITPLCIFVDVCSRIFSVDINSFTSLCMSVDFSNIFISLIYLHSTSYILSYSCWYWCWCCSINIPSCFSHHNDCFCCYSFISVLQILINDDDDNVSYTVSITLIQELNKQLMTKFVLCLFHNNV